MGEIKSKYIGTEDGEGSYLDIYEVNGHIVIVATPTMGRSGVAITAVS